MDDSPFGKLSAELRNEIYSLVLTPDRHPKYIQDRQGSRTATQPALTRVCKQFRSESLLMFYALEKFSVCIDFNRNEPDPQNNCWFHTASAIVSLTIRWLEWLKSNQYLVVGDLVIETQIYFPYWEENWNAWRQIWRKFAAELKELGYRDDWAKVVVDFSPTYANLAEAEGLIVKRALERLRFACVID